MDLKQYSRVLGAHWLAISAILAGCVAIAAVIAWTQSPTYAATTQLFVSNNSKTSGSLSEDYAGLLLSQQRVASYTQLITSSAVLSDVAADVHARALDLGGEINATAPGGTSLIDVTVKDSSPKRAKAIADSLDRRFPVFIDALESSKGASAPPVKVSVTGVAKLPTHPIAPRKKVYLLLGALLGLLLGGGFAVVSEALDRRIRNLNDAATLAGAAALGSVAEYQRANVQPLVMVVAPTSVRAEEFRRLRTNLQFLIEKSDGKGFVVSSAVQGEGKTFVACNLAIAFAQAGQRVVLVDADLRRPRIHALMGFTGRIGLIDVIRGLPVTRALVPWRKDVDLLVLPAGRPREEASELIASREFADALTAAAAEADVMIIDTPALLPATDAAIVAKQTIGAVLVARAGFTRTRQLDTAVASLQTVEAHVLGVVVNRISPRAAQPGYGAESVQRLPTLDLAPHYVRGGDKPSATGTARPRRAE
jgi:tyrosine-protein kinase